MYSWCIPVVTSGVSFPSSYTSAVWQPSDNFVNETSDSGNDCTAYKETDKLIVTSEYKQGL